MMDRVVGVEACVGDGGDGGDGGGDRCSGRNGGGAVAIIRAERQPRSESGCIRIQGRAGEPHPGRGSSRVQGKAVAAFKARQ
jgi:hypothetical protein